MSQKLISVKSTSGYDSLDTQTDPRSPDHLAADLLFRWHFQILVGEVDQERVAKARIAKISRTIYSKEYKAEAQINAAMLDKHHAGKKGQETA